MTLLSLILRHVQNDANLEQPRSQIPTDASTFLLSVNEASPMKSLLQVVE